MKWKCVPQILGLVRGDAARRDGKGKSKHRANVAAIVHEAFEIKDPRDGHAIPIRKSASETYDRSRTKENRYIGFRTADDTLQALEDEAAKQVVEVHVKDKTTGEAITRKRTLRSDAVIGLGVIYKPPCEIAKDWTPEQYDKFIQDSKEVMAMMPCGKMNKKGEIIGDKYYLFRQENIVAAAEHHDEGARLVPGVVELHEHTFYVPKDQSGKYNGNMVDALFLSAVVTKNYPRMMRERGWDIDDCDVTDWERYSSDAEYRAERKAKRRKGGKPVNNYIADKKNEQADASMKEAQELLDRLVRTREAVAEETAQAEADLNQAHRDLQAAQMGTKLLADMRASMQEEISDLSDELEKLSGEITTAEQVRKSVRAETAAAVQKRNEARAELLSLKSNLDTAREKIAVLKSDYDSAQAEVAAAELKRNAARKAAAAAEADRKAAQQEADQLRRDAVARAEQTAKATQARLEAEARAYWENWLEHKKKWANAKAAEIIRNARARAAELIAVAAEAAKGEYEFLLRWLANQNYQSGRTFLEAARAAYEKEIRARLVSQIPEGVRDAGMNPQEDTGRNLGD